MWVWFAPTTGWKEKQKKEKKTRKSVRARGKHGLKRVIVFFFRNQRGVKQYRTSAGPGRKRSLFARPPSTTSSPCALSPRRVGVYSAGSETLQYDSTTRFSELASKIHAIWNRPASVVECRRSSSRCIAALSAAPVDGVYTGVRECAEFFFPSENIRYINVYYIYCYSCVRLTSVWLKNRTLRLDVFQKAVVSKKKNQNELLRTWQSSV